MIFGEYKGIYLYNDVRLGIWYGWNLKEHRYTTPYKNLDALREDIRLNKCKWVTMSELTACKRQMQESA